MVEEMLAYVSRYMVGKDYASYCDLQTAVGLTESDLVEDPTLKDPYTLVTRGNSFLTAFEIQGMHQIASDEDFGEMVENLRVRMAGYLSGAGHSLSCGFERDPHRSLDELMRLVEPQLLAAKRMGLKTEDILLDRVSRMAPFCVFEQNLLMAYTHLSVLSRDELNGERKAHQEAARKHKLPRMAWGQNPGAVLMALKSRHDSFTRQLRVDLLNCGTAGRSGVLIRRLSAHEAVKRVRIMCNRERTSQLYRPLLPGDPIVPHGREDELDYSDLAHPPVSYQVCANDVTVAKGQVGTDGLQHGVLALELGPQEPQSFAKLFATLSQRIPWRVRFDISPDGLNMLRGRRTMVAFTGLLPGNERIRQSFLDLAERAKEDPICSMKVTASTWSESADETRRRTTVLEKALQSWGSCAVTSVFGDYLGAWASTIPGFNIDNVANRLVPPLPDALHLLPLQRPATPWSDRGSLLLRTPDGKIFPVQLGSALQDTWIDLISAPPGSGKSVLMNCIDMALVHASSSARLPLISIIDVGVSSSGLISLLRDALPEDRRHEVELIRLQNSSDYAVNPFDTQLGARFPTVRESEFLSDFLSLLCTEPSEGVAPPGTGQVVTMLLELAFQDKSEANPNGYEPRVAPDVDAALERAGVLAQHDARWWQEATWWEVTDLLFEAGCIREAGLAQRQAVPVLSDFAAYLQNPAVRDLFGSATVKGSSEELLQYIYRCLAVATNNYAVFAGRTRFELGSGTRVVAIDLNDVMGTKTAEGKLRSTVMYLFARQMAAKNYFLREEFLLPIVPEAYRAYHAERLQDIQDEHKTIAYDETHNAKGLAVFAETLEKDGREGRKSGIHIVCTSQYLSDHPEKLLHAATSIYVMRGGSKGDKEILEKVLEVPSAAIERLQREAVGPGPEGGTFLALFRTKVGFIAQMLTNTVGPVELWAFNTTHGDMALRNRLYKELGTYEARRLLAKAFPSGTAGAVLESMQEESGDSETESVVARLASSMLRAYRAEQKREEYPLGEVT